MSSYNQESPGFYSQRLLRRMRYYSSPAAIGGAAIVFLARHRSTEQGLAFSGGSLDDEKLSLPHAPRFINHGEYLHFRLKSSFIIGLDSNLDKIIVRERVT